jgi:arylsulfatase A-like enzyme
VKAAIKAAGLDVAAPDRGLNTDPGDYIRSGVHVANVEQQDWFARVATDVLLPRFKAAGKPFVMVFWSRDPDGTQHNNGDSLNTLTPGINGPTSLAAIRNASNDLQKLRDALKALGLDQTTDVVVTADHGFSVASKQSQTSPAAKLAYRDVKPGFLPPGFLAIDLSKALNLNLYESSGLDVGLTDGFHPRQGGMILGADAQHPQVIIGVNGGSDMIWLPGPDAKALAPRIVAAMVAQDYTGAVFVRDDLGPVPGALPTSLIGLAGSALTPAPAIVVSFRSFTTGCDRPEVCGAEVADTTLQQGQGIHGSFGRQDTHNFMAAIGPDFKTSFVDPAPVSNADLAVTLAQVLGLDLHPKGALTGRVLGESLTGGAVPTATTRTVRSDPAANGFTTVLNIQDVGPTPYFDAAGDPGRTLGLQP